MKNNDWKPYKRYDFHNNTYLDITDKDAKGKIFVRIAEANKWQQISQKDCDTIIKEYSSIRYVFTANEIWEMYISK